MAEELMQLIMLVLDLDDHHKLMLEYVCSSMN